ncbi:hypothetical protein FHU39_003343 [Flexivirga oryzae]|uniref:Uncharacterized protein n=1 Tax=Flexivirga oryzae TaxID=1794944 RepID=A0A839NDS7_9MICO|nr:hypothetical protein [Flexivirga oryzae]
MPIAAYATRWAYSKPDEEPYPLPQSRIRQLCVSLLRTR